MGLVAGTEFGYHCRIPISCFVLHPLAKGRYCLDRSLFTRWQEHTLEYSIDARTEGAYLCTKEQICTTLILKVTISAVAAAPVVHSRPITTDTVCK